MNNERQNVDVLRLEPHLSLRPAPELSFVVPCYNEEAVLLDTAAKLGALLGTLIAGKLARPGSRIVFVDDGSKDATWPIIARLCNQDPMFGGIKLSRNRGHQNALLAGLLAVPGDAVISIDADLQDDLGVIPEMLRGYMEDIDIVFGVRDNRDSDTFLKRTTAEAYYGLMKRLGAETLSNHADFRLMSRPALEALREFREVNLYLRGIVPLLGFPTRIVKYRRGERLAGATKYPLGRLLALAGEGITSFSTRPLRLILITGTLISIFSFAVGMLALGARLMGNASVPGWTSTVVPMFFIGGIQILSIGVIGEYLGKIYMETKARPRFIVEQFLGLSQINAAADQGRFADTIEDEWIAAQRQPERK